jgi:hypothetical protein
VTKSVATVSGVHAGVAVEEFVSHAISIPRALDAIEAGALLASGRRVVLKPNLVNHSPHPITTPPAARNYSGSIGGASATSAWPTVYWARLNPVPEARFGCVPDRPTGCRRW